MKHNMKGRISLLIIKQSHVQAKASRIIFIVFTVEKRSLALFSLRFLLLFSRPSTQPSRESHPVLARLSIELV